MLRAIANAHRLTNCDGLMVPIFGRITFSAHALQRMEERGISRDDVHFAVDNGEVAEEEDGIWYVELGTLCVALAERDHDTGHVVTAFHRRKRP